ncbi:MAG TPA: hypothetical protein VFL47_13905, partial [Flavisolibacter sp.]|nr:hypothetical protein [Flavisolibacter sp.]
YEDIMIESAGFNPYEHRRFLQRYYSGEWAGSPAAGALFSVNPKTGDARISGTLASLCGLEKALRDENENAVELSIQKILLMQAHSFFVGGIPMLFYGDEVGYTNDYSYKDDAGKSYDNRWMHRPLIDWSKNERRLQEDTVEYQLYNATKKLLSIRAGLPVVEDLNNHEWIAPHNLHVAGFVRRRKGERPLFCLFNFSNLPAYLGWYALREKDLQSETLFDYWSEEQFNVNDNNEHLIMAPYGFYLLEPRD